MSLRGVCEAWAEDLTTHVAELADAKVHLFAPWSLEKLVSNAGETHLGVWPTPTPRKVVPFATGDRPTDQVTTMFTILVWRPADVEASRGVDDETTNGAWLDLTEQLEARFRVQANAGLGQLGGYTRLEDIAWNLAGEMRWAVITFSVRSTASFT